MGYWVSHVISLLTFAPTDFTSSILIFVETLPRNNDGDDNCEDECFVECFSYAIENCVSNDLTSACIPPLPKSCRFLTTKLGYHKDALAIALDELKNI